MTTNESNTELRERVATLEERSANRALRDDQMLDAIEALNTKVDGISNEMARYRGWTGGVLFVVAALTAALKMFGASIVAWFD